MLTSWLLAIAAVAGAGLALHYRAALVRARRAALDERSRAERRGAALAASCAGFWIWPVRGGPGTADDGGVARDGTDAVVDEDGGMLAALFAVPPEKLTRFDDVVALLREPHGGELARAVGHLRAEGTAFSLRVETADGGRVLDARGRRLPATVGSPHCDAVWLQDVTDAAGEETRLAGQIAELTAQNAGLRHVLDGLAMPIWVRGPDLALVYCNRAYARAVDEDSPASAVAAGKEIASGASGWGRGLAEAALTDGEAHTRSLHIVVEGKRRLHEMTEFPIGDEDAAWGVAGIAVDQTEAEDARIALAHHVAAHAEVLEKLGTGMAIFGPDAHLQFFNVAFSMMWGFDPDWLETGPTHGEVLEDLRARRMYPEQPDFQDYKRQRLDLYTTLIDTHEELLYLPNERVIRVVISPHPLGGLIFINEDVTDRLTLERSYNTLIAVQSETLNNLHEGIAVYGADSCLKLFNPAFSRIWRLDPALLREEPRMAEVVDAAKDLFRYQGSWESFREQIIANSADRTARAGRFERADGSILDYAAVPLPDGAMLFTYIDVTDSVTVHRALRERNEALVAADRLKSEFITNVSYELRTPLNTIIGFTEILVRQYFGTLNRRQMEYGEGILEASRQLLALIDDILDLALIEAGRLELDLVPTDIAKMVDAVAALTREHARKVGIVLVVDCDRNIGVFTADERRIKQALFNLVSNAIKYTPSGGRIVILARRDKDGVMLAVRDTGSGIAEEYRDRVFEKFERGHGGDGHGGDGHGGVGLGLALVKSFVLLHGGEVTLESTVGKGTCVTLWLPATPPAERPRLTEGRALWADTGSDA
jgi:signal transduction histidine kinase